MIFPEFTFVYANTFFIYRNPYTFLPETYPKENSSDCYYFEFYHKDFEGGNEIDGILYKATANCYSLCKPQQRQKHIMPYSCYHLRITTQDPELKAALDTLPAFGYHPEMDQIIDLCKKIIGASSTSTLAGRLEIFILTASILRLMLDCNPNVADAKEAIPRRHQAALDAANQYLKDHLDENLNLTQLAQHSNLYPTYFHKLFTEAFGRTPAQQLMWHRMQKAFFLLQDDNCPIVEVAQQCGFSSHSYFCYKFKEMWGATPTEYRQRHRASRKKQYKRTSSSALPHA